ncbi:MAG: fumarate hydratase, partial [Candidatus Aminicenantes bacterium]|nr:fumarate hydratase [Candidatus Aminicenantes bacterium]
MTSVFPLGRDRARYRRLDVRGGVRAVRGGTPAVRIADGALAALAGEAFTDLAFGLKPEFLAAMRRIMEDPAASDNDRFVTEAVLRNAVIAAEGVLPLCQDTGSIQVFARRGHRILTAGRDEAVLAAAAARVYATRNLRYSIMAPLTVMDEVNTGTNLPAQIDIEAVEGAEYRFFFAAKGGGSSNKTALFQESKALLEDEALESFLAAKIRAIGVAACPPYRIAVVVGGLSPEMTLKAVKLASAGFLDELPKKGGRKGAAFRDPVWEERVMRLARETGLGAQFGGRWLAHEARVIRLPRHGGSCPVGLGVSCNADRGLRGKITAEGVFLEKVERRPARYLDGARPAGPAAAVAVDLDRPMADVLAALRGLTVGTLVRLSGPLIVARDIAHARLAKILRETGDVPDYFKRHPIYYAGPAKTPHGSASGSFGPTTAQRMDGYMDAFLAVGASLVSLGKGNRTPAATDALKAHGGIFLGTIGGAAALIAKDHIVSSETVDFAELGMEAVRKIVVRDLPAFVIYDGRGGDLYA